MIRRLFRRWQKPLTMVLLFGNLLGARVVTVRHACERPQTYFLPSAAVDFLQKSFFPERSDGRRHSLGLKKARTWQTLDASVDSQDLATVTAREPVTLPLPPSDARTRTMLGAWKQRVSHAPIPPPHPPSKK